MEPENYYKALIVDDTLSIIDFLKDLLTSKGFQVYIATSGEKALQIVDTVIPDIILLDILMTGIDGYETCRRIKNNPSLKEVPIIIMSALQEPFDKIKAFNAGASDYISKPIEQGEFFARINNQLRIYSLQKQLRESNEKLENRVIERTHELMLAKEKAEESDRLKSAFLANISHEIRTPLNGILGFSELFVIPDLTSDKREEYKLTIVECADKLLKTVSDILDLSKLQAHAHKVEFLPVNIHLLMKRVNFNLNEQAKKKDIKLELAIQNLNDEFIIYTDERKLGQIFEILIENAIKFTEKGSVTLGYTLKENIVEFYVKDTGVGIPEHLIAKVFDSFRQVEEHLSRVHGGTGIGLAICKGLVELLKGNIRAVSKVGEGSAFFFSLYVNNPVEIETNTNIIANSPQIRKNNKLTILVAEDEEVNRLYVNEILFLSNHTQTFHASNGIEAVDMVKAHLEINLVLMDVKMPFMDGLEAMRIIKTIRPELPVIALTAYASNEDKNRFIKAGFDYYIAKPIRANELTELINTFQ